MTGRRSLPPRTAIRVARELFTEIDRRGLSVKDLMAACDISRSSLENWRAGRQAPMLLDFEILAHVVGYRLTLEPIEREDTSDD